MAAPMKATVKWIDGVQFLIESGTGHAVLMEGPESEGGRGIGIRPMELMLMGLGGCTSFDVLSILKNSSIWGILGHFERVKRINHLFDKIFFI